MRLGTALRLGRVSNLPTVITNVLAGCMLSTTQFSLPVFAGLFVAMTLVLVLRPYGLLGTAGRE